MLLLSLGTWISPLSLNCFQFLTALSVIEAAYHSVCNDNIKVFHQVHSFLQRPSEALLSHDWLQSRTGGVVGEVRDPHSHSIFARD